ncbi:Uncharacterised protein [Haploplasma axanthum]|uniref:ATPase dynein-related AAA domain-containing protein n=1 Tax=Haploplasma axanthum TaxID=29552 RepID=A0A449BFJ6_HAPAX|nr:Uncharacterised protein [Haploplasma axanthum]
MGQFSQWFVDFFRLFLDNLWRLIKSFFVGIYNLLIGYPIEYAKEFLIVSKSFSFLDWMLSVFFIVIFLILVVMFFVVVFQLLKRYFRFTKIEYEKLELLSRMNVLERKLKNGGIANINNVPKNELGFQGNKQVAKTEQQRTKGNRFVKLTLIDEKYKYSVLPTYMKEEEKLTLSQLVTHFRNYSAKNHKLYYNERIISIFLAGMATSKIMILEGISGTGKTSLPYAFGKFINHNSAIISVQPSWRDRYEMMGYLNEFTKKFNETEFLKTIYETTYRTDIQLIVLDEMNLARVEYYFADFLSLLELPNSDEWLLDIVPEQIIGDPINLKEGKIKIPENIWFVGTANKDDSTFAITDKVYDRAASIEMNDKAESFDAPETPSIKLSYKYIRELFDNALDEYKLSDRGLEAIKELDNYITKNFEITFGNRIMKQLLTFVPVYIACGRDEVEGIDYIVSRKIIRKFETLNLPFLKKELEELLVIFDQLFGKDKLIDSKTMIQKYIRQI